MHTNLGIYGGAENDLTCGSQSIVFGAVSGLEVHDPGAVRCNCGACPDGPCPQPDCDDATLEGTGLDCEGKPLGTWFGVCLGSDDNVDLEFQLDIDVKGTQFDAALYIATDGGNALYGDDLAFDPVTGDVVDQNNNPETRTEECRFVGLTEGYFNAAGEPIIGDMDGDLCLDFVNAGELVNYPFQRLLLRCTDTDGDELLDFSVGASYGNTASECFFF